MPLPPLTARLLSLLGWYLNTAPDWITPADVALLCQDGLPAAHAVAALAAQACGLDPLASARDKAFFHEYFLPSFHRLDPAVYRADPYYQHIHVPQLAEQGLTLARQTYRPYECFVFDDLYTLPDGRLLPKIGFFEEPFTYPALLENGRLWMSVTPNEINTMAPLLPGLHGHVLTYGLGMGYFAYRASQLPAVHTVTAVDNNPHTLDLFHRCLLPQFPHAAKIRLVQADALTHAATQLPALKPDCVFADLWHDVSDGLPLYRRLKALAAQQPAVPFYYWIENTLKHYL